MTYPVDDAGNPRVDFVWGNFPLQPDQQRQGRNTGNKFMDGDWMVSPTVGSDTLSTGWTTINRNTGDGYYQEINRERYDMVIFDSHEIATTGYSNYPAFLPNYGGDGDAGLEVIMPNIIGLTNVAASTALTAAGLTPYLYTTYVGATVANDGKVKEAEVEAGAAVNKGETVEYYIYEAPTVPNLLGLNIIQVGTALTNAHLVGSNTMSTDGATALNNGKVKSQAIAAGTKVDTGTTINYVLYNYVVPAHPIAGMSQNSFPGHAALIGNDMYMYLLGRTTKPTAGDTITISGNSNTSLNRNWTVNLVENNDSYNSGGTVCTLTGAGPEGLVNPETNSGGTWVVV